MKIALATLLGQRGRWFKRLAARLCQHWYDPWVWVSVIMFRCHARCRHKCNVD